jgi:hypothetical protein
MCSRCRGFSETIRLGPREYRELARQLTVILHEGTFVTIRADCQLSGLTDSFVWPGDVLFHIFKCTRCGTTFQLFADTYHGSAKWELLENQEQIHE